MVRAGAGDAIVSEVQQPAVGDDFDFRELLRDAPAYAPPAPVEALLLIALETSLVAWAGRATLSRGIAVLPVIAALFRARQAVEGGRACELGLQRAGDLPVSTQRVPLGPPGAGVPILLALPPSAMLALIVARAVAHRLRGRPPAHAEWHHQLARMTARDLLRRYDWRRAGGPARA